MKNRKCFEMFLGGNNEEGSCIYINKRERERIDA